MVKPTSCVFVSSVDSRCSHTRFGDDLSDSVDARKDVQWQVTWFLDALAYFLWCLGRGPAALNGISTGDGTELQPLLVLTDFHELLAELVKAMTALLRSPAPTIRR